MRSPGRPREAGDSVGTILRAATTLFAEHGFHGVTTRSIAAAAELNIATVHYHLGTKAAIYRAVFARIAAQEQALIAHHTAAFAELDVVEPEQLWPALDELIEAMLATMTEYPETARLWVRRWLERPPIDDDVAADYALPVFTPIRNLLQRAQAAGSVRREGLDLELFLQSFSWMLYGYVVGGPLDWHHIRTDPNDPAQRTAFGAYLKEYARRMLQPIDPR